MPFSNPRPVALGATRASIANRLSDIARDLTLIARQCEQGKLFDDLMLDHLDRLADRAEKDARLCQEFAQDVEYKAD
jgi:hypothetical protein